MTAILFLTFVPEGAILGILAFLLKYRHSDFPDFRVGYHMGSIMESKEKWDYANQAAGNICGISSAILFAAAALLYGIKAGIGICILLFFALSVPMIAAVLVLPIRLVRRKFEKI